MDSKSIFSKFENLTVWKRGGERAPHKPLLALYALSCAIQQDKRLLPFSELNSKLIELLHDFGPPQKSYRPEYPFWRMQKDGVWEVKSPELVEWQLTSSGDAKKSQLLQYNAHGGFPEKIYKLLKKDPSLFSSVVQKLLEDNFPPSIHEDILQAVGIDLSAGITTIKRRDPDFRNRVLRAYENRCAICGFDIRLDHTPICLEAAHIKWHTAGGPDEEKNGLALCTLHHKLFDRGAFTFSEDMKILVSDRANGSDAFNKWLLNYHGQRLTAPNRTIYQPSMTFRTWHVREVFKGEVRE
jgi:putative restriction endonuclease